MPKEGSYPTQTNSSSKQKIKSLIDRPIISIKEARKLLGAAYNTMSDEQILGTIGLMRTTAELMLEAAIIRSTKQEGGI